jgi:hypothetical protein
MRDCANQNLFSAQYVYPDDTSNFENTCLDFILNDQIDLIFHVSFNESYDLPESVAKLALKKDIPVVQLDPDSSWRFSSWVLPRKNRVSHFVTTHSATIPWYEQHGMKVIKSQWAGSPLYKPDRALYKYDVSFVGQRHGQMPNGKFVRSETINCLLDAGLKVDLFGNYWDGYDSWHGYIKEFADIISVFNTTRVNLSISNPWHFGTMPQIKGRHFEIPQCQAFQLTTPADDLTSYFVDGKEIIVANSVGDMIDKAKFYLENSREREAIALAGRERMLRDHQWSHRFEHIFKEVGI